MLKQEIENLRKLAAACRKQARIATSADTASALERMADGYESEAIRLLQSGDKWRVSDVPPSSGKAAQPS